MRKITIAVAGAAAAAAAAGLLVPAAAQAATTADTNVTFSVAGQGGGLSITAGGLGTIVPGAGSATGILPTVSVTDNRSAAPRGYTVTASSTDFTGTNQTIPKANVTYTATAVAGKVGPGTLAASGAQSLSAPAGVLDRAGLTWPLEIATFTPALTVDYSGGAAIGAYSGTITLSVA